MSSRWAALFGVGKARTELALEEQLAHELLEEEEDSNELIAAAAIEEAAQEPRKRARPEPPAPFTPIAQQQQRRVRLQIAYDNNDEDGDGGANQNVPAPNWRDDNDDEEQGLDEGGWWANDNDNGDEVRNNAHGTGANDDTSDDEDDVGQVLRYDAEVHGEYGAYELGEDEDQDDDDESENERDARLYEEAQRIAECDLLAEPTHAAPMQCNGDTRPWERPGLPIGGSSIWQPPFGVVPQGEQGPAYDESLLVQHVETTYGIDEQDAARPPVVRLFGLTEQGNSVQVNVRNFRPYFYAQLDSDNEARHVRDALERYLHGKYDRSERNRALQYVLHMEPTWKRSICGWHRHAPLQRMYKITMAHPAHVREARNSLEGRNSAVTSRRIITYEANVPFELRFMADARLGGCQWFRVPRSQCTLAGADGDGDAPTGRAQIEVNAHSIHSIHPIDVSDKGDLAPMRFLSFDIEAKRLGTAGGFVQADRGDPAVLICSGLKVVGSEGVKHKAVFALVDKPGQSVSSFQEGALDEKSRDATVYVFHDEREMLLAFAQYVRECDPDAFTGWNITNFDWPYLIGRAKALGCLDQFLNTTRLLKKRAWLRQQTFQSKAYGAKKTNELVCDGRMDYDALLYFLRGGVMQKFRSYKLNAIAKDVIGKQKLDVHHSQIPILHEGSDAMRRDLAEYCLWDALLPLELLDKMMAVVNGIEQSRVTGVSIKWLLSRGQGIKTFSNILRYKDPEELVPSRCERLNNVYTVGGYVRDPIAGHYKYPIATLDFASLYPSIMQAYNICYSTVESLAWARAQAGWREGVDYWVPPTVEGAPTVDFCFVAKHVREGVLPRLLTALLAQRRYVKRLMGQPEALANKLLYNVLNGRQNALKVVCNSVYGFLKAFILIDPRLMTAVTSWGQTMIKRVADMVTSMFAKNMVVDRVACEAAGIPYEQSPNPVNGPRDANGALIDPRPRQWYPARIIYGDTDSVMVDFGDIGLQDVVAYAKQAARVCTEAMQKPNELAFESIKIYSLLMRKKRYGSLEIELDKIKQDGVNEETGTWEPGYTIAEAAAKAKLVFKGLESKRRDNAPIGSETQSKLLEYILLKNDLAGGIDSVKETIASVLADRIDMGKFVITKGLSKLEYATKQHHTWLREKMIKRAGRTGEVPPETGDRVPYIMFAGTAKDKSYERAEDPMYALNAGIPIDKSYYIGKQIMSATLRILTCAMGKLARYSIFSRALTRARKEPSALPVLAGPWTRKRIAPLRAFQEVFRTDLPHMLHRVQRRTRGYGIGAFARRGAQCMQPGCAVKITPSTRSNVVCDDHVRADAQAALQAQLDKARAEKDKHWLQCTDCAGGSFDVNRCNNTICDNFYRRHRAVMDVEDLMADLVPFEQPERVGGLASDRRGVYIDHTNDAEWMLATYGPAKRRPAARRRRRKSKAESFITKRERGDDDEQELEHAKTMERVAIQQQQLAQSPVAAATPKKASKAKKPPPATLMPKDQRTIAFAARPRAPQ